MTIPAQRVPTHDMLPPEPRRRRRYLLPVLFVVLLGGVIAVPTGPLRRPIGTLAAAAAAPATASPPAPYELARQSLDQQAAALLRGDRAGWLAAVDPRQPALRKHYQDLYASLTALHVTHVEYHSYDENPSGDSMTLVTEMAFCFEATCPEYVTNTRSGPPRTLQQLTLKLAGDRYVITKMAKAQEQTDLQPLPWEAGDLVFAQGKRVTVAAPRALAKRLPAVLAVADKAALTDDRIARYMNNPQPRYRIFLATDHAWKTWYGGETAGYSVAYAIQLNNAGSDVVLRMSDLAGDAQELKVVIQHELAHVATLSNLHDSNELDRWLMEGVAEYVGWLPQHTRSDWNFPAIRAAFRGSRPPRTMVQSPIRDNATGRAVDAFYGLGHFAVDCLVAKYGEAKAMTFVRLKLRSGNTLEEAARGAFGTSFAVVDKSCMAWMRDNVR